MATMHHAKGGIGQQQAWPLAVRVKLTDMSAKPMPTPKFIIPSIVFIIIQRLQTLHFYPRVCRSLVASADKIMTVEADFYENGFPGEDRTRPALVNWCLAIWRESAPA